MSIVSNLDDLEKVLHHSFYNECRVAPEEHPFILTEPPRNPKALREKMCQIAFETFNVPAFYLAHQATLPVFASGRLSGLSVLMGERSIWVVPVWDGHALDHFSMCLPFGGRDITDYLMKLLTETGYSFTTTAERDIVRDIKEKLCFLSCDYEADLQASTDASYELPDGQVISLSSARFRAPECIFSPSLMGLECEGLAEAIVDVLAAVPDDMRAEMFQIVLSGGTSRFPSLANRLQMELEGMLGELKGLKAICPPESKVSCWIGGSILASLSNMNNMYITKEEYDEVGPRIVHRKCF